MKATLARPAINETADNESASHREKPRGKAAFYRASPTVSPYWACHPSTLPPKGVASKSEAPRVFPPFPPTNMGKQYNKTIKRRRRKAYVARKMAASKATVKAKVSRPKKPQPAAPAPAAATEKPAPKKRAPKKTAPAAASPPAESDSAPTPAAAAAETPAPAAATEPATCSPPASGS